MLREESGDDNHTFEPHDGGIDDSRVVMYLAEKVAQLLARKRSWGEIRTMLGKALALGARMHMERRGWSVAKAVKETGAPRNKLIAARRSVDTTEGLLNAVGLALRLVQHHGRAASRNGDAGHEMSEVRLEQLLDDSNDLGWKAYRGKVSDATESVLKRLQLANCTRSPGKIHVPVGASLTPLNKEEWQAVVMQVMREQLSMNLNLISELGANEKYRMTANWLGYYDIPIGETAADLRRAIHRFAVNYASSGKRKRVGIALSMHEIPGA